MGRKRRIEYERGRGHPCTRPTRQTVGKAQQSPRRLRAGASSDTSPERLDELEKRIDRGLGRAGLDLLSRADTPGELDLFRRELGGNGGDRAPSHAQLALTLKLPAPLRRLLGVDAVEDERIGDVGAVRDVEQPRPELVVLTLFEPRVVAQLVALEDVPVDDDGGMEERRAEERGPAHLRRQRRASRASSRHVTPRRARAPQSRRRPRSAPLGAARAGARAASASRRRPRRAERRIDPRASSSPRFSDAARPSCASLRTTRMRGSPNAARIAGVRSVDASSTTTSSRSERVCPRTLASAVRTYASPSRTATRTVTSGAVDTGLP